MIRSQCKKGTNMHSKKRGLTLHHGEWTNFKMVISTIWDENATFGELKAIVDLWHALLPTFGYVNMVCIEWIP